MTELIFECPNCGIQTEVNPYYLSEPMVVECDGCTANWAVESTLGDCWLDPIRQVS